MCYKFITEGRKLVFILIVLGCNFTPSHGDAGSVLSKLSTEYFEWRMSVRPESSTYRGYHKYNDILESFTLAGYNESKVKADEYFARLTSIPRDDLSRSDKLNYDILENMLSTYRNGYEWRLYNNINPLNLMEGPQTNPSSFTNFFPFHTVGDYENYLARLTRLPDQIDERISLFREAVRLGTAYNNVSVNLVIDQIENVQNECPQSHYPANCAFLLPFTHDLDQIHTTNATRATIRSRGVTAVNSVVDKFGDLKAFLQNEYMPATRQGYGVVNLHKGREFYQACLKWYLSLDLTPEEVHQKGLDEVKRISDEMKRIMTKNHFQGSISEYFAKLKNDSTMFYNSSEAMLDGYRDLIENRVDPHLAKLFNNLPGLPIVVKPLSSDGPAGRYSTGSKDGSIPGIFWANVIRPAEFPKFSMLPLTMHEANPGHHLQLSYNLLTETPDFRSKMESSTKFRVPYAFPSYTAFTEGWALYAESLGEELGLYKDDNELMGRYSSEIFRACRLVVDTGIHYYNWTKDEAIDYILEYTTKSRDGTSVEIDRYITWPGQACSYKIGELKIKEVRQIAEKRLGEKFDIRAFHTSIMDNGAVPLDLLERNVNEWIEEQLAKQPQEADSSTCSARNQIAQIWLLSILLTSVGILSH
ncbi:uncharacterized protein LOC126829395 isoform X1 [Patella vulgata]|uniref:uncharacterized protein LOC126829395 isoform X1 n=1 Tax=Patella vulgata TaxID=6465 RepID=UPI0024A7C338|nr:uncharacterized protein LOC126829395 isoform X1 [Patella vulgata]XP_050415175.2 uncharacterized protein LOC126829395 isoform X1 [Patella vulgata]